MSRFTKPTTRNQLEQKIQSIIWKNPDITDDVVGLIICADECTGGAMLDKDIRAKFNFENVIDKGSLDNAHPLYPMLGPQKIGNVTCQGFLIGTDYGTPFYAILYKDHKNQLRGYVPIKGNAINPITNLPFGDGGEYDDQIALRLGYAYYDDMACAPPAKQAFFYDVELLRDDIIDGIKLKP